MNILITKEFWDHAHKINWSYRRKADDTLWHAGGIVGDRVQLWAIDAWGGTVRATADIRLFNQDYELRNSNLEPS